jgi:hypothetical protein
MSTRARVGIEMEDGSVLSSYVHFDGMLSILGFNLVNNYSNADVLLEAIELGDASTWDSCIESNVYYGRDRKETDTGPRKNKDIDELLNNLWDEYIDYGYVLTREGIWVVRIASDGYTVYDAEDLIRESYHES